MISERQKRPRRAPRRQRRRDLPCRIPTDEERMIGRHTLRLLKERGTAGLCHAKEGVES